MTDALLLIDLQVDFLTAGGRMPIAQEMVKRVLRASSAACREARQRGWAIVAVGNGFSRWNFPHILDPHNLNPLNLEKRRVAMTITKGAAWDPRAPEGWDAYFAKHAPSSFTNMALDKWLRERGVTHLHLAGAMAGAGVAKTANGALQRGYQVSLIPNGIGARSEQTRVSALRQLRRAGCGISEVADQPMEWFRREELPTTEASDGRGFSIQAVSRMWHFGWGHSRRG